jgi:hypothetical protein
LSKLEIIHNQSVSSTSVLKEEDPMTKAVLQLPLPSSASFQKRKTDRTSHPLKPVSRQQTQQTNIPARNRHRGVILALQGWNKLQTAKAEVEFHENEGDHFTLEELSERTELSLGTLSNSISAGVSRYTRRVSGRGMPTNKLIERSESL